MGKYCHYLCFIDGESESKILFKVTQDPGPQSQSEREIGDIYLIFPLKVTICWMNKIYILNKDLGSELVKIAPPFFFLLRKMPSKLWIYLYFVQPPESWGVRRSPVQFSQRSVGTAKRSRHPGVGWTLNFIARAAFLLDSILNLQFELASVFIQ